VVAHSMGGGATMMALAEGLRVDRVVLMAPPCRLSDVADRFCATLRLPKAAEVVFRQMIENEFGADIWARASLDNTVQELMTPALIVHDVDDTDIPFSDGQAVAAAWKGSRLVTTAGLGHHRILRDGPVLEEVVRFVSQEDDA